MWKKAILFNESLSLEVISGGSHGNKGPVKVSKFLFPLSFLKRRNNWHYFHGDATKSRQGARLQADRGPACLPGPWDPRRALAGRGSAWRGEPTWVLVGSPPRSSTPVRRLPPSSPRPSAPFAEEPEALTRPRASRASGSAAARAPTCTRTAGAGGCTGRGGRARDWARGGPCGRGAGQSLGLLRTGKGVHTPGRRARFAASPFHTFLNGGAWSKVEGSKDMWNSVQGLSNAVTPVLLSGTFFWGELIKKSTLGYSQNFLIVPVGGVSCERRLPQQ